MKLEDEIILHFQIRKLDLLLGTVTESDLEQIKEEGVFTNRLLRAPDHFSRHKCEEGVWSLTLVAPPPQRGESVLRFKSEVENYDIETPKQLKAWTRLDRIFSRDPEFWRGDSFPFTFQHRHIQVESRSGFKWDIIFCQSPGIIHLDGEVVWNRAYPTELKINGRNEVEEFTISNFLVGCAPYYDLHGDNFTALRA